MEIQNCDGYEGMEVYPPCVVRSTQKGVGEIPEGIMVILQMLALISSTQSNCQKEQPRARIN